MYEGLQHTGYSTPAPSLRHALARRGGENRHTKNAGELKLQVLVSGVFQAPRLLATHLLLPGFRFYRWNAVRTDLLTLIWAGC